MSWTPPRSWPICWRRAGELLARLQSWQSGANADFVRWGETFSHSLQLNATPLVTADLVYDDEVNRVRHTGSLAFDTSTRAGEWKVQVKDVNRKIYGYTLTYFVAPDNQPHVTDTQFQEKGLLVIPKYQPA